ncbi:MAG: shikimate kinase AroK [Acidiferrobacterales bacterium]
MSGAHAICPGLAFSRRSWHIMPAMNIPQNIYLVGPMGAGKSTIGRHLADMTDKQFRDADQEIENRTGASIPLIFEIEGEEGFRRRESAMLAELAGEPGLVLATGGGVVLTADNRHLLSDNGFVVYLHADIEILYERTRHDRNRPLLNEGDRRLKLAEIMAVRDPLYREVADLVIETDKRPAKTVARKIFESIQARSDANT